MKKYLFAMLLAGCSVQIDDPIKDNTKDQLDQAIQTLKEANLTLQCLNEMVATPKEDIANGASKMWRKSPSDLSKYEVQAYLNEMTRRCKEKNRE